MDIELVVPEIKRHEGLRLEAYWDDIGGVWTIGYGHAKDVRAGDQIDLEDAECILYDDIRDAEADCKELYGNWELISLPRKTTLVGMAFNLGRRRLSLFRKMNRAVNEGDWPVASLECFDSRARRQHDALSNPRYREYAASLMFDQLGWRGPWRRD